MIFLRKGCEFCVHTSGQLFSFTPLSLPHNSISKPVYTHPSLLVKLCAGTLDYLKMKARLWQVWSSLGSPSLANLVWRKKSLLYPLKLQLGTFTRDCLTLPALFHCDNPEPWNDVSCSLPGRGPKPLPEWAFGTSWLPGVSPGPLAQAGRSRSWAAVRDRNGMFPAGGLNASEWSWKFPWQR